MKLKDLLQVITTYNKIRIVSYTGEEFYPSYSDLERYRDYHINDISAMDKNVISISIRLEEA